MRKLLQNRTVVSSLCAMAVLSAVGNFVKVPVGRLISATARPVATTMTPGELEVLSVLPVPHICTELTEWRDLFPENTTRRDPFALFDVKSRKVSTSTNAPLIPVF